MGLKPNGLVTLTSDFGDRDGYVGAIKGVLLSVDIAVRPVDIGHRYQCPIPRNPLHLFGKQATRNVFA